MDPILAALTAEEITEALGAYVLRKQGLDPGTVRASTEVSYNWRGNMLIAAVRVSAAPAPPKGA